ncbi:MAG: Gfo/Idh/MocA family oxidoreductase [Oscillospiraceae bacterium]|nr:Gfo/Idh/MocA family oxidoreductase [Oscillospiraceae bacterium]
MGKIRIAQIGIGHDHAKEIFPALCGLKDHFEVVGYALPECEKNNPTFQKYIDLAFAGYREMTVEEIMNDPTITAVAVETEEVNLSKYALLAAKHGKHIHMDKPGGIEPAEFEELIRTAKENNIVLHLGYMYRYNPCIQKLLQQVKNGELGEINSVEAHMGCCHGTAKRQWLERFPGGMMFFLGSHLVDLILQMQGIPEKVTAFNKATGIEGTTSDDLGFAVLEYKNGVSFVKTSAAEMGGFSRRQLVVNGSKGSVRLMPLEMVWSEKDRLNLYTDVTEYKDNGWFSKGETTRSKAYDRYNAMMTAFAKMVSGETENPYTYDYELTVYQILLKCCGCAL